MKNRITLSAMLLIAGITTGFSQVGIGTETPEATLDVRATNPTGTSTEPDGMLVPRIDRQRAQNMSGVSASTLVYVNNIATGTATGQAVNIDSTGFYYYDGSEWQKMGASGVATPYEAMRGNVRTTTALTYTVQSDDFLVVTNAPSTVTITFPNLTAAEAGRVVYIFNNNTAPANNSINLSLGNIYGLTTMTQFRGYPVIWTGTYWVIAER